MDGLHVRRGSADASHEEILGDSTTMSLLPQSNITPSTSYTNVFEKSVVRKENKITQTDDEQKKYEMLKKMDQQLAQIAELHDGFKNLYESVRDIAEHAKSHSPEPPPKDNSPSNNEQLNPSQPVTSSPESSRSASINPIPIILVIGIVSLLAINIYTAVAVQNNNLISPTTPLSQLIQSSKCCSVYENHFTLRLLYPLVHSFLQVQRSI